MSNPVLNTQNKHKTRTTHQNTYTKPMHATQLIFMDAANTIADSIAGVTFSNPDDPNTLIWKPSEQCQLKQQELENLFLMFIQMQVDVECVCLMMNGSVQSYKIVDVYRKQHILKLNRIT